MKKNFDIDTLGKKIPYRVPEGFFEKMQEEVMERVSEPVRPKHKILWLLPMASAIAAVLTAVMFLPIWQNRETEEPLSQVLAVDNSWIEDFSDEELELMNDFSEYDIFMK